MKTAEYYIQKLKLTAHPEGGWFKEVYRSNEIIMKSALFGRYSNERAFSTSIYFLLESEQKSLLHKLNSDEIWHFYDGSPLKLFLLDKDGNVSEIHLGRNLDKEEVLQFTIPNGQWFCAEVQDKDSFTLTGCTVSPGFDFSDFELGAREKLFKLFPHHKDFIVKFTSGNNN